MNKTISVLLIVLGVVAVWYFLLRKKGVGGGLYIKETDINRETNQITASGYREVGVGYIPQTTFYPKLKHYERFVSKEEYEAQKNF